MTIDKSKLREASERLKEAATKMLEAGADAPTFSARFFGPSGELGRLGVTRKDRELILRSELYRWLKERYEELRLRDAAQFEQDVKVASGRLTVAVPRSLHAALKGEAAAEGVSLSELIRLKLSIPYRQMANLLIPKTKAN
ncbi:MAG TPA: toxin-antitoxin system HicB family antitoxin [Vicinamibacteria bacterium]|nr:toxin-antitoxin system HicB family antitoxin [Vicinamibacteria bacterium]